MAFTRLRSAHTRAPASSPAACPGRSRASRRRGAGFFCARSPVRPRRAGGSPRRPSSNRSAGRAGRLGDRDGGAGRRRLPAGAWRAQRRHVLRGDEQAVDAVGDELADSADRASGHGLAGRHGTPAAPSACSPGAKAGRRRSMLAAGARLAAPRRLPAGAGVPLRPRCGAGAKRASLPLLWSGPQMTSLVRPQARQAGEGQDQDVGSCMAGRWAAHR